ncbi:galactofuranosylgalactofuranosylrhamnosyl-N-acetylglucosaminyl-diphospho-decaprenol beta-1,5/1,6-galactofuranosyltransferase [Microbacterium azadirachtae]|uniref:Galactofuranosylgalactofuranosylrhamnosyl-N-acetylglucosaminyl-diphospho-decaprenol beta-1,5/1,6-galactofuranosyltransferase n=1 Tax=Microbacterium azadirachtae TaxID=582680 RepID=A0A1I6GJ30_9MICO|nr:glycosyltransferase [Microbacterium azadirachtae]SFR42186.1 galactofuranosylgalactofuranosylrhamnosyl-N-acetylglucosaminyl-diphospho-decaprenol beta-1,5/1,6-galactofuranosyltransferase [Microbacterium azadirachtae]
MAAETGVVAQRLVFPVDGIAADAGALYVRGPVVVEGRRAVRIPPGVSASFATYFNAFPAGIWASATGIDRVALHLSAEGEGVHRLRGVTADGVPYTLAESRGSGVLVLDAFLPQGLTWIWLEVETGQETVRVFDAEWRIDAPARPVRMDVAITTMNRVDDCALLLHALGDAELTDVLAHVVVVDQGTDPIGPHAPDGPLRNGVPLRLIVQENLGGSGGFSRGMLEALGTGATHVLLLDDDVRIEPESIRRLHALASTAVDDPLLGAQMLSMLEPTVLHSMGEQMDRSRMWWHSTEPELSAADLAAHPLESTPGLRRFRPVDFNGWWMCLVPTQVVRAVGASLPLFIKWDDAEFGLRAAAAGHRTLTIPGVALWHVPWTSKDDGLDWQAYFQLRNRLVTALVHERRPRRVLWATWTQDVNHVLCLQYGSGRLRNVALEDVLSGPEHLSATLRGGRERAQRILAEAGQAVRSDDPARETPASNREQSAPQGTIAQARRLTRVLLHQLAPVRPLSRPAETVQRASGKWWRLGLLDDARLRSASGSGSFLLHRSRSEALALLRRSAGLRIRLWWSWRALSRRYREAARELAGQAFWRGIYSEAE